jgi:hypothetical protein
MYSGLCLVVAAMAQAAEAARWGYSVEHLRGRTPDLQPRMHLYQGPLCTPVGRHGEASLPQAPTAFLLVVGVPLEGPKRARRCRK